MKRARGSRRSRRRAAGSRSVRTWVAFRRWVRSGAATIEGSAAASAACEAAAPGVLPADGRLAEHGSAARGLPACTNDESRRSIDSGRGDRSNGGARAPSILVPAAESRPFVRADHETPRLPLANQLSLRRSHPFGEPTPMSTIPTAGSPATPPPRSPPPRTASIRSTPSRGGTSAPMPRRSRRCSRPSGSRASRR